MEIRPTLGKLDRLTCNDHAGIEFVRVIRDPGGSKTK